MERHQDSGLSYYELPCSGLVWSPVRPFVDRGMAAAVTDIQARRRTITVYGDPRRITEALDISDTGTITIAVLDSNGGVWGTVAGAYTEESAERVRGFLAAADSDDPAGSGPGLTVFRFEFEPRFKPLLRVLGVTPSSARVVVGDGRLRSYLGPWTFDTALDNITEATVTGPYRAYRAIGPRGSFVDRGLTFGTTTRTGLCITLAEPVSGLLPLGIELHRGVTLTVADPEGLKRELALR